jgi:AbrB family looped-hinge helix DNA binding protein
MVIPNSTLTSKGQATIPKEMRDRFGLKPGDRLKFFAHPDGHIAVLPARPITELRGIARNRGPALTVEEMDDAITEALIERDEQSRR